MFEERRESHAVVRYMRLFSDNNDIVFPICVLFDNFLTIDRPIVRRRREHFNGATIHT